MNKVAICFLGIVIAISLYTGWITKGHHARRTPDVSSIQVQLNVQRLEQVLFSLKSKEAVFKFLQEHKQFAEQFLGATSPKAVEAIAEQLYAMIEDPHIQTLYEEVQQVFGDCSAIQQQLATAFRHLKYYYPDFKVPQVATFITGMGDDLYVSEDLIVIGLDFFMGEGAKFRPIGMPDYLLRGYQPTQIVPKIALLLSQRFIQTDEQDATLLADMLYYGKAYYFAQALLPTTTASTLLVYTPAQLADVEQHQKIIWGHFIENELLYSTDHVEKTTYIGDSPFVSTIGPRCPGYIGRWLGWEIVKKYMKKHTEVSLPTLMSEPDTQKLFTQSKYRPKK